MYPPQPPQPYRPQRQRRGIPAWVLILACSVSAFIGLMVGAAASSGAKHAAAPAVTVTVTAPGEKAPAGNASGVASAPKPATSSPASQEITEGTWRVPEEVKPGTYRTDGADETGNCYWERLKDLTGGMDSTLANDLGSGPMTVTIQPGDKGFKTQGCKPWKKVG